MSAAQARLSLCVTCHMRSFQNSVQKEGSHRRDDRMPGPSPGRGNVTGLEKVDRLAQLGRALGIEDHLSWGDQLPLPGREGSRQPRQLQPDTLQGGLLGGGLK